MAEYEQQLVNDSNISVDDYINPSFAQSLHNSSFPTDAGHKHQELPGTLWFEFLWAVTFKGLFWKIKKMKGIRLIFVKTKPSIMSGCCLVQLKKRSWKNVIDVLCSSSQFIYCYIACWCFKLFNLTPLPLKFQKILVKLLMPGILQNSLQNRFTSQKMNILTMNELLRLSRLRKKLLNWKIQNHQVDSLRKTWKMQLLQHYIVLIWQKMKEATCHSPTVCSLWVCHTVL